MREYRYTAEYALDHLSAARHVATVLEERGGSATLDELAKGYHPAPGDLSRVRHHEGARDNREATRIILQMALAEIHGVDSDGNGRYRLTRDFDALRYKRKKLHRLQHTRFQHLFAPGIGIWADNIRKEGDLTELRESMQAFGWLPEYPAIVDENGVVLSGHRRLAVAKELRIDPVKVAITLGEDDAGNVERIKRAIASNLGAKPFTPGERKEIAKVLFAAGESIPEIATALQVTTKQINQDVKPERDEKIRELREEGYTQREVADELGVSKRTVEVVDRDQADPADKADSPDEAAVATSVPSSHGDPRELEVTDSPPEPEPEPEIDCPHCGGTGKVKP
jgi:DNA-binding NarL/FixJ family response regulator